MFRWKRWRRDLVIIAVLAAVLGVGEWWNGYARTEWARSWVRLWTDGAGVFAMSECEDQGILDVLDIFARQGRVDLARVLVLRTASNFDQQRRMAEEVQRVGKRYILHTPNRYFPIEPHVLIPFFQFLPLSLKVFIAIHSPNWGWKSSHIEELDTIRLMSERELRSIFPGARVYKERFWGLTKSFILYKGW